MFILAVKLLCLFYFCLFSICGCNIEMLVVCVDISAVPRDDRSILKDRAAILALGSGSGGYKACGCSTAYAYTSGQIFTKFSGYV